MLIFTPLDDKDPCVTDEYCALRYKRFVCMRCGRRYVNGKDLKRHEKYECGKSPRFKSFYSRSCYGAAMSVTGRRRRLLIGPIAATTANTSSPGIYECPKCRKTYKWYRGLHRHLEYECGKAPRFRCPHCVYTGKHRSHVYSHIKNSFLRWSLQQHRINYDEKTMSYRHPCPKCHRSYKHRSHMMRHYRYECGIPQRFECPYCKHHLRQRTHVWTHIRTFHPDSELYCIDIVTNSKLSWQEPRND
ncbi:hypothetical protein ACFW04_005947 [Cataglyphis niger]